MAINTSNNKVRIISTAVSGLSANSKFSDIKSPALVVNTSEGGVFYADGAGGTSLKQLAALPNHSHSDYLPKTGGTVTGELHVNTFHINKSNFSLENSGTFWIGVDTDDGQLFRTDKGWYNSYRILDSSNYTAFCPSLGHTHSYLPLSGGTLSANTRLLTLNNNNNANNENGIGFSMSSIAKGWVGYDTTNGTYLYTYAGPHKLGIKEDGTGFIDGNTIIHSGNIGSQSVASAVKLTTGRSIFGNNFDGTTNILGDANATSLANINATASDANNWTGKYSLKLRASNNAMTMLVSSAENDRKGMIQVGHSDSNYANHLGELYLNPLGGKVIIGHADKASVPLVVNGGVAAHSFSGALYGNADTASVAIAVRDYNSSTANIKIGYTGAALTSFDYFACYGTDASGNRVIKDASLDAVKTKLGLGSAAYTNSNAYLSVSGGDLSGYLTSTSHILGTGLIRVNASDKNSNFGYIKAETYDSNRSVVHIGSNYGGSSSISNSVSYDAIGIYRTCVGIGGTFTGATLKSNYDAGIKLDVAGIVKATSFSGNLTGTATNSNGLAGYTWESTQNSNDTWVPVFTGNKLQYRTIPVAYNSAPSTLTVGDSNRLAGYNGDYYYRTARGTYDGENDLTKIPTTSGGYILTHNGWTGAAFILQAGGSSSNLGFIIRGGAKNMPEVITTVDSNAANWVNKGTLITSSNYNSYALPLSGGTLTGNIKWAGATQEILSFAPTDTTWRGGLKYSWSSNTTIGLWGANAKTQFVWHAGTDFSATDLNGTTTRTYDFQIGRNSSNVLEVLVGGTPVSLEGHSHSGYATTSSLANYLPLAGGQMTNAARIYPATNSLYIGRSDNAGWVYMADTCSQSGADYWNILSTGVARFASTVTASNFITTSDKRLKTNINEISSDKLSNSLNLNFVEFDYVNNDNHSAGHIAQEVKDILPEFVHGNESETEHLSIDYTGLHSVQIAALKSENDELKSIILNLTKRIEALEKNSK